MRARRPAVVLAVALAVAGPFALGACSGGGPTHAARPSTRAGGVTLDVRAGPVTTESAGGTANLSDADRAAILAVVRDYVQQATVAPLQGRRLGDLGAVFDPAAVSSLTEANRATVLDDGLPRASGRITANVQPVPLRVLTDPSGVVLVGASLALRVDAPVRGGHVQVQRLGQLVLARNGGSWRVTSYQVSVERARPGVTASAASGPVAPAGSSGGPP